jgi:hypothetical protein
MYRGPVDPGGVGDILGGGVKFSFLEEDLLCRIFYKLFNISR